MKLNLGSTHQLDEALDNLFAKEKKSTERSYFSDLLTIRQADLEIYLACPLEDEIPKNSCIPVKQMHSRRRSPLYLYVIGEVEQTGRTITMRQDPPKRDLPEHEISP